MGSTEDSEAMRGDAPAGHRMPYVGRINEVAWLRRILEDASSGSPRLAIVTGEPGIGKSRLLREFVQRAQTQGVMAGIGRGTEDQSIPYQPWTELVRAVVDQASEGTLQSLFGQQLRPAEAIQRLIYEVKGERSQLYAGVADLLCDAAADRPVLLVLDDLHWADQPSVELLTHVVFLLAETAAYRPVHLMILVATRLWAPTNPLGRVISRLEREDSCETMQLGGLDIPQVALLVKALGVPRPSHQLVSTIYGATDGNPLFVKTVVQQLRQRGAIEMQGGFAVGKLSPSELDLPQDIEAAIAGRLSSLADPVVALLELAAFLGERFQLRDLVAVSGLDRDEVRERLERAGGFVLRGSSEYQFEHPLIRVVLHHRPSIGRRSEIHARIAERLEELYADRLEAETWRIAEHLMAAGDRAPPDKVRDYAQRAAEQASAAFAWSDAARAYVAAALATDEPAERGHLYLQAGTCFRYAWDSGPCMAAYNLALEGFQAAGDNRGVAEVLVHKARQTLRNFPLGEITDLRPYHDALELIGDDDPALRGYVLTRLSDAYSHARRNEQAAEAASRALALGRDIGDERLCNDACTFLGLAEQQLGQLDQAIARYRQAIEHARRSGESWRENIPAQRLTMALTWKGDLTAARANAFDGLELTRRTRYPGEECMALGELTQLAAASGDFDEVEQRAQETMQVYERSGYVFGPYIALRALACARSLRGDHDGALDAIAPLTEAGQVFETPGRWMLDSCRLLTGWIELAGGRARHRDESSRRFQRSLLADYVETYLSGGVTAYMLTEVCVAVDLADACDMPDVAGPLLRALSWASEQGLLVTHGWVSLVPRAHGLAELMAGHHDRAAAYLRTAIEQAERCAMHPELGRSCLGLARVMASRGRPEELDQSRALVRRAGRLFSRLGMTPWLERADRQARDLGTGLELPPVEQSPEAVSPRGRSILDRLARGETTDGISRSLILSRRTIVAESRLLAQRFGNAATRDGEPVPLTIMVTDMEKSTLMLERLGDRRAHRGFQAHDRIIRACVEGHRGVEIKHTGDGIMAAFSSVIEALRCARETQERFRAFNEGSRDLPIRVRIGVHSGETLVAEEGLFGLAVHIAVRISDYCDPERIVVSDNVHDAASQTGLPFTYLGRIQLKGISEPIKLYEFDWIIPEVYAPSSLTGSAVFYHPD